MDNIMDEMFHEFEEPDFVFGFCRTTDLDKIDVKCKVKKYAAGKKCSSVLKNAKTVIIIGNMVKRGDDICTKGILSDDFPAYKDSRNKAVAIKEKLIKYGYAAKVDTGISIKNACILSGIGVWGKNSLIINPTFGTFLRFSAVLTNYIPTYYGTPNNDFNPCVNCDLCISACPGNCLSPYRVDGLKCMCIYIEKGQKLLMTYPMCSACQDVCPYNTRQKSQQL